MGCGDLVGQTAPLNSMNVSPVIQETIGTGYMGRVEALDHCRVSDCLERVIPLEKVSENLRDLSIDFNRSLDSETFPEHIEQNALLFSSLVPNSPGLEDTRIVALEDLGGDILKV